MQQRIDLVKTQAAILKDQIDQLEKSKQEKDEIIKTLKESKKAIQGY